MKHLNNELKQKLEKIKQTLQLPRSNMLTKEQPSAVKAEVMKTFEFQTPDDASILLAMFAQQGATSHKADGNLALTYSGQSYKLAAVKRAFAQAKCKRGFRKYARKNATSIFQVCQFLEIEGNLVPKIKKLYPELELTSEETYWLSDFQAYNPECPDRVRKLLLSSFSKKKQK
jgi:hypothetical protein